MARKRDIFTLEREKKEELTIIPFLVQFEGTPFCEMVFVMWKERKRERTGKAKLNYFAQCQKDRGERKNHARTIA